MNIFILALLSLFSVIACRGTFKSQSKNDGTFCKIGEQKIEEGFLVSECVKRPSGQLTWEPIGCKAEELEKEMPGVLPFGGKFIVDKNDGVGIVFVCSKGEEKMSWDAEVCVALADKEMRFVPPGEHILFTRTLNDQKYLIYIECYTADDGISYHRNATSAQN